MSVESAIQRFLAWLGRTGYASFDPYDLWGTRYGLFSRRLYYRKNLAGIFLIAPVVALETFCPSLRALFVRKQEYATANAQLLLAFLNLYQITNETRYLDRARSLAESLLRLSIPGYSGHCWGYPFDWQNNRGLWHRNTPFITATPYCYEAFALLSDLTGEASFAAIAESAARFVANDLTDTSTGPASAAASYGPFDSTQVVNASAYRSFVLFDAAARFGVSEYAAKARANLNFIRQSQAGDGSWLYGLNSPGEAFIDHFHTCFVLKNLQKISELVAEPNLHDAIVGGYNYYRRTLFDSSGDPKSFSVQPRTQLVRLEMYNFAEAITLGVHLRNRIPGAFSESQRLASDLVGKYQLPQGYFVTRVFRGGFRHTVPFLRWPQSQLFYALTNLLRFEHARATSAKNSTASLPV